jgi:hypothetical protein
MSLNRACERIVQGNVEFSWDDKSTGAGKAGPGKLVMGGPKTPNRLNYFFALGFKSGKPVFLFSMIE